MHQNQMQGMANSTKAALRPTKGMAKSTKAAFRPTKGMANSTTAALRPTKGISKSTKAAIRPTKGKAALRPTKGMANPTMPISVTSRPSPTNQCRTHPIKAHPARLSQTKWWVQVVQQANSTQAGLIPAKAFPAKTRPSPTKQCRTHTIKAHPARLSLEVVLLQGITIKAAPASLSQTKWWV